MHLNLVFLFAFFFLHLSASFPSNLEPRTIVKDVPRRVFIGDNVTMADPLHVQMLKSMTFGGNRRVVVAAREKVYFLDPNNLSPFEENELINFTEIYTWSSEEETRDLCQKKGQPKELCFNYISILESTDNGNVALCGTNAYSPQCSSCKISTNNNKVNMTMDGPPTPGRLISPFGPDQSSASTFAGGALYSATYESLFGGTPVITRTMGKPVSLRIDSDSSNMRNPEFIKITEHERRVLIFFNEEYLLPSGEIKSVAQVAQICKNDKGGDQILHRMFTTFLKARLNCSYNGFYLDHVRDVIGPIEVAGHPVIFASFATPDNSLSGSAVCIFNLSSIHAAFTGPFYTGDDATTPSYGSTPPSGTRHPGLCSEEKATDPELVFIKSHSQMKKQVIGSLLLTYQGKRWTALNVDISAGPSNKSVLFLGTEDGHLLRALPPSSDRLRGTIISDQFVFDETRCAPSSGANSPQDRKVEQIVIEGDFILVAFKHCFISIPLHWCSPFSCRSSCLSSSDPYCGWNGTACLPFLRHDDIMEQDLTSSNDTTCSVKPDVNKNNTEIGNSVDPEIPESTNSNTTSKAEPGSGGDKIALGQKDFFTMETIVFVGVGASVATFLLLLLILLLCRCCAHRRSTKTADDDDFSSLQFQHQHEMARCQSETRSSLSRKAKSTLCGFKFLFFKENSRVQSPIIEKKKDIPASRERRQNEYTDPPARVQVDVESATSMRKKSTLRSPSSVTSREDDIAKKSYVQPLLTTTQYSCLPINDPTLPRHFSEQATLLLPSKPTSDSSSSAYSSGSSGSTELPENGNGAAESTILYAPSDKHRTRGEFAARETEEIMKESGSAVRRIELVLNQMQEHRTSPPRVFPASVRQRLESHDSGRGDSCRNSLRTDIEQTFLSSRPPRPSSLNICQKAPGRRRRLHSEGSHPLDTISSQPENDLCNVTIPPHSSRERRSSGAPSVCSSSPAPVFNKLNFSNGNPVDSGSVSLYATLPKHDISGTMSSRKAPLASDFSHQDHHSAPLPSHTVYSYHQMEMQRGFYRQYSTKQPPHNYYPSLQIRGAHAQKPMHPHFQPQQHNRHSYSPPQTYYNSLQLRRNHTVTTCAKTVPFQQNSSPRKPQKPAPLSRHTSMPASTRPIGYVSPVKACTNGVA